MGEIANEKEDRRMGKVRDEIGNKPAASKPAAVRRHVGAGSRQFLGNLLSTDQYKPIQGRHARLYTALGLGVIVAAGALLSFTSTCRRTKRPLWRLGIPASPRRRSWAG